MKRLIFVMMFLNAINMKAQLEVSNFSERQQNLNRKGMRILSAWAIGNMAIGTTSYFVGNNAYVDGFSAMSAGWNIINLGIGLSGAFKKPNLSTPSFTKTLKENMKLEKIYLFNAGLDFGYVVGGFWLHQYGVSEGNSLWVGAGDAVVMQGLFLAIFDAIMYYKHYKNGKKLIDTMEKIEINMKGNGLEIKF